MQDFGLPSEEDAIAAALEAAAYKKPRDISDLIMHESMNVHGPKGSYPNEMYTVTKVPGGWLYHLDTVSSYNIPPVFVPEIHFDIQHSTPRQ